MQKLMPAVLVLIGILFINGCIQEDIPTNRSSSAASGAILILETNTTVSSVEHSKNIFLQNYDTVIQNLKNSSILDPLGPFSACTNKDARYLKQHLSVEKRERRVDKRGDNVWVSGGKKEKFVIKLPAVSADDIWKYESGEVLISFSVCMHRDPMDPPQPCRYAESFWTESAYLTFIMDERGAIYFAEGHCFKFPDISVYN